jgi:hypothetical protein
MPFLSFSQQVSSSSTPIKLQETLVDWSASAPANGHRCLGRQKTVIMTPSHWAAMAAKSNAQRHGQAELGRVVLGELFFREFWFRCLVSGRITASACGVFDGTV